MRRDKKSAGFIENNRGSFACHRGSTSLDPLPIPFPLLYAAFSEVFIVPSDSAPTEGKIEYAGM
jgi:hypothetical protein